MKQGTKINYDRLNVPKKQYEQPRIQVIELERQVPLLAGSNISNPNPGSIKRHDI